jgi:hypothetical protein
MRVEAWRALAAALFGSALASTSCVADDVVVADSTGDASMSDHAPTDAGAPCSSNDDCAPRSTMFCAKPSCDAPTGMCEDRPLSCDDPGPNVCGCDGITYWNDCLRKQNGVATSAPDQCPLGVPCDTSPMSTMHCPNIPGAHCARLVLGPMCDLMAPGTCWVLPPDCAPLQGMMMPSDERWAACAADAMCLPTCDAIRTEMPFHQALGPSCP